MGGPLEWMAWTTPTALFFGAVFLMVASMALLGARNPSYARKGFLPIETTRGDRLYIGLIVCALINLAWLLATDATQLGAVALCALWMVLVLRWG
jgi:predicted small integral membrane protein